MYKMFCKRAVMSAVACFNVLHQPRISKRILLGLTPSRTRLFSSARPISDCNTETAMSNIEIKEMLTAQPKLQCVPIEKVQSYVQFLLSLSFQNDSVKRILVEFPALLQISRNDVQEVIGIFKKLKISESDLLPALSHCPTLLFIKPDAITKRVKALNGVFTRGDAAKLIECCPNVYFDNWSSITQKLHYILFEMGFDQKDCIVSNALRFDLEHIRLRHHALLRSGHFKKPNPKNRDAYNGMKLKDILRTSETKLLNFAELTIEEYLTLERVLEQEIEDEDEDDDSDEESY